MQKKNYTTCLQGLILVVFIAMILACASSRDISKEGDKRLDHDPTSAELIYESTDSLMNTQLPNESDLAYQK